MVHFDPVCGRRMNPNRAHAKVDYKGEVYYLCCPLCQSTFEKDPERYVSEHDRNKKRKNKH